MTGWELDYRDYVVGFPRGTEGSGVVESLAGSEMAARVEDGVTDSTLKREHGGQVASNGKAVNQAETLAKV